MVIAEREIRGEIAQAGATKVPIDVSWAFNPDNHLVLSSAGAPVIDFNAQHGVRPLIRTINSALFVKPDRNGAFEFTLMGRSGRSYSVEFSTDFSGWTNLTNITLGSPQAPAVDVGASNGVSRFYRVRSNP